MVLLLPVYVWYIISKEKKERLKVLITFFVIVILVVFFTYLYLLIRSSANPPINWGNPSNIGNLLFHITRGQYGKLSSSPYSFKLFLAQISNYLDLVFKQFNVFIIISLFGVLYLFKKDNKILISLIWILLTAVLFIIIINFEVNLKNIESIKVFYIPSFLSISLLICFGIIYIYLNLNKHIAVILSILIPMIFIISNYSANDLSSNYIPYHFNRNILKTLKQNSTLFVYGDNVMFPLAYLTKVEKIREDVVIYDDIGCVFKNIYGDDFLRLSEDEKHLRRNNVQKNIIRTSDTSIYFTLGSNLSNMEGISYEPVGIVYRVKKAEEEEKVKEIWGKYNLDGINKKYDDYLIRELISIYNYFLGEYYFSIKDNISGLNFYRKAFEIGFDLDWVKNNLIRKLIERGYLNEVINIGEKLPQDAIESLNIGIAYFKQGKYDEAEKKFKESIRLNPDLAEAYCNLGVLYDMKGDLNLAKDFYELAIRKNPNIVNAYLGCAMIYGKQKDYSKALECFKKVLNIDPDNEMALKYIRKLQER
jgi:tetratricopeptide (TPR) repeat protein